MKTVKRRGRPPGSKNKILLTHAPKKEDLSPWLNEVSDLNQEIIALRHQLRDAEAVIRYLERKYEDPKL